MTYNLSLAIRTLVLAAMPAATFAATVSAPETVLTTFAQYTGDGPLTDGDSNAGVRAICESPRRSLAFDRTSFASDPRAGAWRWER